MIRATVTKQFMKMFKNCAIEQNGAILWHFHELLRNPNLDHYIFWCIVSEFQIASFKHHNINQTSMKKNILTLRWDSPKWVKSKDRKREKDREEHWKLVITLRVLFSLQERRYFPQEILISSHEIWVWFRVLMSHFYISLKQLIKWTGSNKTILKKLKLFHIME